MPEPSTLDDYCNRNQQAGPHTEAEHAERVAASRRGAVLFLAVFFGLWLAWIVGRALWFAL
jgi:hypothetical protein